MATSFWNFKAPSSHDEEMEMRQAAAAAFRQAEIVARNRQREKEQEERDHEAWKRHLLRDRNVTIHASTNSPSLKANDSNDNLAAFVVGYTTGIPLSAAGLIGAAVSPHHSDSSSDSSSCDSSSSDSSSSGGTE